MPSSETISLQARIHWRCLSWFKAMKWPSANEVDFGAFLVVFDFKKGVAIKQFPDGSEQVLATFIPQKETREVSCITGEIACGGYQLALQQPLVDREGKVMLTIQSNRSERQQTLDGDVRTALRLVEFFTISPKIKERDVFLDVATSKPHQDIAILIASLLVFSRFSV